MSRQCSFIHKNNFLVHRFKMSHIFFCGRETLGKCFWGFFFSAWTTFYPKGRNWRAKPFGNRVTGAYLTASISWTRLITQDKRSIVSQARWLLTAVRAQQMPPFITEPFQIQFTVWLKLYAVQRIWALFCVTLQIGIWWLKIQCSILVWGAACDCTWPVLVLDIVHFVLTPSGLRD